MSAAILLSGGMDSAALAWWLRPSLAIFIDYGQRPAKAEERAAIAVADALDLPIEIVQIDCHAIGSGDLAGVAALDGAPTPEWWPYRNQLLVTIAAATALRRDAKVEEILIGTVFEDRKNGDGAPAFVAALDALLRLQEGGVGLRAPAIDLTSAELVSSSKAPLEFLGWTHSCFVSNRPCLRCRGCSKHLATLEALDMRYPRGE